MPMEHHTTQHRRGRAWLAHLLGDSIERTRGFDLDPATPGVESGLARMLPAVITGHNGAPSHARRYDATALGAPAIQVSQAAPLSRPIGTEAELVPAEVGSLCILMLGSDRQWSIWQADERIATTTCAAEPSAGTGEPGVVGEVAEQGRAVGQRSLLTLDEIVRPVSGGTQERLGLRIYTFPPGVIRIDAAIANLNVRSATVSNALRVGMGTVAADGAGTSLLPDHQDIVLQVTTGALSATGMDLFYASPSKAVDGDVENITGLHVGVTTPIAAHLNIAPTTGWSTSGDLIIEGTIELLWYRLESGLAG